MKINLIRNDDDLERTLQEIESLVDAEPGSEGEDRLIVLSILAEAYEDEHFPVPDPDPIEAIIHTMEALGLARGDLEPFLGSRARVSEILNRRRHLSLAMIRRLEEGLGIPAEVLIQPYELVEPPEVEDEGVWISEGDAYEVTRTIIKLDMGSEPSGTSLQFIGTRLPEHDMRSITIAGAGAEESLDRTEWGTWLNDSVLLLRTVPAIEIGNIASDSFVPAMDAIIDDSSTEVADQGEVNQ